MTGEILIVADDLSGAADCAIACARHGLEAVVMLEEHDHPIADVIAVDANTRWMSPAPAAAETARIFRAFERPGQILFKKIDSTLRGNIGPEVAAALEVSRAADRRAVVVMAPAFPSTGRTTVDGRQHLNGLPMDEKHWRIENADVPRVLETAGLRTTLIGLDCIRSGPGLEMLVSNRAANYDALVCDAETDEDLRALAIAALPLGRSTVWAGSAGLARHLPEAAGLSRNPRPISAPSAAGPLVFAVGSYSEMSREQAEVLAREPGIAVVKGPQTSQLSQALTAGRDILLLLDDARQAKILAPHVNCIGALILTGGETARAALQALDVRALRLVNEVEPGVPLSITQSSRPLPIITKAGAFGDPKTLVRCRQALKSL